MIILIDNYDSFSYNLYQLIGTINPDIEVVRNDAFTVEEIKEKNPEAIIISPGPGRPEDAGICIELIKEAGKDIPILGVCLGHQAICTAYGGRVSYAAELVHGKQHQASVSGECPLFEGCGASIPVARYHSLSAVEEEMPECLKVTARTDDGEIMAVQHRDYNVFGLQFHPESIMTPDGEKIIRNFLKAAKQG